jgi:hypothetical protein
MAHFPKPNDVRIDATPEEVLGKALAMSYGLQSLAAERAGIDKATMYERVKRSPYLQAIIQECIEKRIDDMELGLTELIEKRNLNAIMFGLRTLGKSRGYVESAPTAHTADVYKALSDVMSLWAVKQREVQESAQIDLNNEDTIISSDN